MWINIFSAVSRFVMEMGRFIKPRGDYDFNYNLVMLFDASDDRTLLSTLHEKIKCYECVASFPVIHLDTRNRA